MSAATRTMLLTTCGAALGLIGLTSCPPAVAGKLDRCDEARITAHNAVMDKYNEIFSELDRKAVRAKAAGVDPEKLPYADRENRIHYLNVMALKDDLERQEETDSGHADRKAASSCDGDGVSAQDMARIAEAIAMRGIAAVLPKHIANVDLLQSQFQF